MLVPEIKIALTYDKKVKRSELEIISVAKDAEKVFRKIFDADTFDWIESMVMICLNRNNKVIGFYKVSSGGVSGTMCDPKVIFTVALNCGASSIMLAHNHPSGNVKPSQADILVTKKIKSAGELLEIHLFDHLILTNDSYFSMQEEGII